ncbi:mucin-4-like [Argopecten irradians]|uniref:mucin-4-like n=1 Tax=Argopecten irradians TaxID=31199 RepID=UPI0037131A86
MEVYGRGLEISKCWMALWIGILVFALVLPDGVRTSHMSTIDERTGISPRNSVSNTRISSRNTRTRSGVQAAASPSRTSSRTTDQRGVNRLSERCIPGRTCDQAFVNSRSSVRTNGRTVTSSQGSQRRTSSISSSRARVPSRTRSSSRVGVSSRSRATPRNIAISRASEPTRTAAQRTNRVASRSSTSSRGSASNISTRTGASLSSGPSRASSSSRARIPFRASSRSSGSAVSQRRPATSTRSSSRSSSSSGVAVREPTSSSGTSSRGSSRAASRSTSWRSSQGSSSTVGVSEKTASRTPVAVNRSSSRRTSGNTSSTRGSTQRSNTGQRTRSSSSSRTRPVATKDIRRSNPRARSGSSGGGITHNNALPPSINSFLDQLKSSMPGSVGVGVGMSVAEGNRRQSNTRQSTGSRSRTSSVGNAVRTSGQRRGAGGSGRAVGVDRIQPIIQPIIRPTFDEAGLGIDNQRFGVQDNLLNSDAFMANDLSDPRGIALSGNDRNVFINSPVVSSTNDGVVWNPLDLGVPITDMNQGIIQNLDQFAPEQQTQFVQDVIPQNMFPQSQSEQSNFIQSTNQLDSFSQGIGVASDARTAVGVMNEQIQPNSQQIMTDMQGSQTQTRQVDPIIGVQQKVINAIQGMGQTPSAGIDPIIRNDQFMQGNTVGNVFGRVSIQSQGHSPVQQVQQPIQQVTQPIQQIQQPIQQVQQPISQQVQQPIQQNTAWQTQAQIHQSPAQQTFVNSNTQGTIQSSVGSNAMQVPQQTMNHRAPVPNVPDLNNIIVDGQPVVSSSQTGVAQSTGIQNGIEVQPQRSHVQTIALNSPHQQSVQVQEASNSGIQQQSAGVVQSQQLNSVNQNQFSRSINDMQHSFPIPSSPVHDQGQLQQVQGQLVQDQSGAIGQFITPSPVDQVPGVVIGGVQSNTIQTSGVIQRSPSVLGSQLAIGQTLANNNAGGMQQPISHSIRQDAHALGAQTNAQGPLIAHQNTFGGASESTFTQQIANQPANTQPLIQTLNQQPIGNQQAGNNAQVLSQETIHQIHRLLTGQPVNTAPSSPPQRASIGTIGGQTFQGIGPAAPVQSPLFNQVSASPNSGFNGGTTANPNKRMVIQIDPNSKGVKIVPDGMGGVRVISLREAVTVSPFGNDTNAKMTQGPMPPLSVPLGSSAIGQSVPLATPAPAKPPASTNGNWEAEPEINTGVTDIPEEIEINGTSLDATPPNAGLDAGAVPSTPEVPTAAFLAVTAKPMNAQDVPMTPSMATKAPISNTPTPDITTAVTEAVVSSEVPTEPTKPSGDDEEDESNFTSSIETINIIDPFYGGMRRDLVRNTNVIQELINRLALMEYNKNKQIMHKVAKEQQSADMVVNNVLAELVKLENERVKVPVPSERFVTRRSTVSTNHQAGVTQRTLTTTPTPVVNTLPIINNGTTFTGNQTIANDTASLSIADIHAFLHTFPNSKEILKRLTDIFANKTSTPAPSTSNTTQTTMPTTKQGSTGSARVTHLPQTASSSTRTTQTPSTTETSITRSPLRHPTPSKQDLIQNPQPEMTSINGLPSRLVMTAVNGDISFGDEAARSLNQVREPEGDFGAAQGNHHNPLNNILRKTTRTPKTLSTTSPKPKIATPTNSATFSLKNGNGHSSVAVYGNQVSGNGRGHHHVKEHNKSNNSPPVHQQQETATNNSSQIHQRQETATNNNPPVQHNHQIETTVSFRPMMTTSKTTPLNESPHWVTRHPGSRLDAATPLAMDMNMPPTTMKTGHTHRDEFPSGTALSGMASFMPMFGHDMMEIESNKRIEPNLNNIFSKALNIQAANGMQIKQLPRAKRTSGLQALA